MLLYTRGIKVLDEKKRKKVDYKKADKLIKSLKLYASLYTKAEHGLHEETSSQFSGN